MKKYYNLKGALANYGCSPFRTESSTKSKNLIKFQKELNNVLYEFKFKDATAENIEALWVRIQTVNNNFNPTEADRLEAKYAEIYAYMDKIGERFANAAERAFDNLSLIEQEIILTEYKYERGR